MANEVRLIGCRSCDSKNCSGCNLVTLMDGSKSIVATPESLRPKGRCKFCEDLDWMQDIVCYVPHDNGNSTDIPVKYCPNCGAKMEGGSNETT